MHQLLINILGLSVLFAHCFAYALSDEEIACNKFLEAGQAQQAVQQAGRLLKANASNTSALICQGRAYNLLGQQENALNAFKQAASTSKDTYDQAVAVILAANTYKRAQQFSEAIKHYEQAVQYAEAAKNNALKLTAYLSIGDIYFAQSNFSQALEIYQKAYPLGGNDNERGDALERTAATYFQLKQYDLALEQQLKTAIMMEKSGTLDQYANANIVLGRYYLLNKNYANAEKTLNKIIQFAKERGGVFYEAQGSYVLAQVKVAQNDQASAKSLVDYARGLAKTSKDKALEEEINRETATLF